MNQKPDRRGLFRAFLAAVFGCGASAAAASSSPAPRCCHYYDGVLWAWDLAGQTGHYSRDTQGCPYCRLAQVASQSSPGQDVPIHRTTRTYS